jgi:hypothetical protein
MNDKILIQQSLSDIFKINGYEGTHAMTQRDFEHISEQLRKKSGIIISGITLKRLSHGEFSRLPQIATLNAIANYFDFKTWQDYKSSVLQKEHPVKTTRIVPVKKNQLNLSTKLAILVLLPVVLLAFYLLPGRGGNNNFDKAIFSAHKNTSNDIPNTVVFTYDIDQVKADSFFIQQSWDVNRKVRIYKNKHTLTDIYYEPGYHIAKLIANDSIIKAVPVSIPTDKWFFCANENKVKYLTEYIKTEGTHNGMLTVTAEDLAKNKIEISKEKAYVYSYFPSKLEINSENFTLKTRVRMKAVRNNFCPFLTIEVFCERYMMMIKSTPKGCASEAQLRFGEIAFSGKETDLESIAYDVTQWTDVELRVRNKYASVLINGKLCFSVNYQKATKLVSGLTFLSNGLCEIDHVELMGSDGKYFYKNDFNAL